MKAFRNFFLNEFNILGLIVANAILIFIQEFEFDKGWLGYLDSVFTLLFLAEMYIKISEYGFKNYISQSWNKLDFILVLIAVPSLAELFTGPGIMETNILLVFRVLRVFKSFRLIKFIPNINEMMQSVKLALKASYIVIFGFFIMLFIFALISSSLFKNIAPEYFNNPLNSLYAIFQLFSIEGWYEIPDLIASRTDATTAFFTKLYFSVLLFAGGILGLSLVNSIFVDAMVSDNNDELEAKVSELSSKIDRLSRQLEKNNRQDDAQYPE